VRPATSYRRRHRPVSNTSSRSDLGTALITLPKDSTQHRASPETRPSPDAYLFLKNYRDFCCLNFKRVLSLLYVPSGTAYGTDLVEKDIGIDK